MKTGKATSIFIVLVTGMVFMSGCISSATTGTGPVATPGPQIVSVTVLVTPSPAPAIIVVPAGTAPVAPPATEVMHESVFVPPATIPATEVMHETVFVPPATIPATEVMHETVFVPPATLPTTVLPTTDIPHDEPEYNYNYLRPVSSADGATGTLVIRVEGCSADGLTVFVARNGMNVTPLDTSYLLDRMVVENDNPVFLQVKILPDGSSETVRLAPGDYSAYLPSKDSDEIEDIQSFKIGANFMTYVSLSGSSYSTPSSGCTGCSCRRS